MLPPRCPSISAVLRQDESQMQQGCGRSMSAALAPLAMLLTVSLFHPASADSLSPPQVSGLRASQCDEAPSPGAAADAIGCARIQGYVAAGSEFAAGERIGGRHTPFDPPSQPVVTGIGPGPAVAPTKVNPFLLEVSHDGTR